MPELARITLPTGTTYTFKDTVARSVVGGGVRFMGISDTEITDGSSDVQYILNGSVQVAQNGDMVIYGSHEFIFSETDGRWHEFGGNETLGALAYLNTVTGNYTPYGSISTPTFTGASSNVQVQGTPDGSVNISTALNGTTNYTPQGSVTLPTMSISTDTANIYAATSETSGGRVTNGVAAQCTLPELTMTVENETLTFGWSSGSFTPNTPTSVVLPSFSSRTIIDDVNNPTYNGSASFSGTAVRLVGDFVGTQLTMNGTVTPQGTISTPIFTGTPAEITSY